MYPLRGLLQYEDRECRSCQMKRVCPAEGDDADRLELAGPLREDGDLGCWETMTNRADSSAVSPGAPVLIAAFALIRDFGK